MSKFGRKQKQAPDGFEYVEPILTALENELREKVNEPHEGLRKNESQWPIHQINWQKSRYIYDMYYTYGRISKQVYDYCVNNKLIDAALIAKWKKPGYERLCSTYVINPRNYKFGTVSICRVPSHLLPNSTQIEDPMTGCRGCASGSRDNIFGNKYGQYLAAIQIAREERAALKEQMRQHLDSHDSGADASQHYGNGSDGSNSDADNDSDDEEGPQAAPTGEASDSEESDDSEELGPVGAPDGSSGESKNPIWANAADERDVELPEEVIGRVSADARNEAMSAAARLKDRGNDDGGRTGPPGKRYRPN